MLDDELEGTAFDPALFGPVVIIQLNRIYDTLMTLLATSGPRGQAEALRLNGLHAAGMFLSPPPAFANVDVE